MKNITIKQLTLALYVWSIEEDKGNKKKREIKKKAKKKKKKEEKRYGCKVLFIIVGKYK